MSTITQLIYIGRYMSTNTSRSTYRPTLNHLKHLSRHIDRYSTDTSIESRSICRPIYRSRGAQNTHDPRTHTLIEKSRARSSRCCGLALSHGLVLHIGITQCTFPPWTEKSKKNYYTRELFKIWVRSDIKEVRV